MSASVIIYTDHTGREYTYVHDSPLEFDVYDGRDPIIIDPHECHDDMYFVFSNKRVNR